MSKKDELRVSKLVEENLNIEFQNHKYVLDKWGQVDNWCQIDKNTLLFLEVETSQKHPNTNVLKVWPYLIEHNNYRVFMIQTYFPFSPGLNSNRGRLSEWLGNELRRQISGRFEYNKVIIDEKTDWSSIKEELSFFKKKHIRP